MSQFVFYQIVMPVRQCFRRKNCIRCSQQKNTSLHLFYCDDIDNGDDNSNMAAIITTIMITTIMRVTILTKSMTKNVIYHSGKKFLVVGYWEFSSFYFFPQSFSTPSPLPYCLTTAGVKTTLCYYRIVYPLQERVSRRLIKMIYGKIFTTSEISHSYQISSHGYLFLQVKI